MYTTTIGLDIAKSVFQVHGEADGKIVLVKRLRRSQMVDFFAKLPASLIGIEACGSAHYWARTLAGLGHEVRLIPAAYVKPFVRRNKTDARDAAAICRTLTQPDMRFVPIKSVAQQAARGLERSRDLLVKQHTQLTNNVRSQLAELGIVAAQGQRGFKDIVALLDAGAADVPPVLLSALRLLVRQIDQLARAIFILEKQIVARARENETMRRLATIPGIGPLTAHAIVTAIADGKQFACARDFAAWCGLTRRVDQSADKRRERGISRQGEMRLRKLLALGASTTMRHVRSSPERASEWQRGILARRPVKVAVVAQAARNARIAWAMLQSGQCYRRPALAAAGQAADTVLAG
jgi:transposase